MPSSTPPPKWRQQREAGALAALAPKKRGRKPRPVDPQARREAELERENVRLRDKLKKAETIIEVQNNSPSFGGEVLMEATTVLSETVGVKAACSALGLPRATYYRRLNPNRPGAPQATPGAQAGGAPGGPLDVLPATRFVDQAPRQI